MPTPSAGSSAKTTEARYVQLLVERHRRDLAAEEDVEARAARLAAELVYDHSHGLRQCSDVVIHPIRDCDRDARGIWKWTELKLGSDRREWLRVQRRRVG